MPVQYCRIVENSCYLNTEFGLNLAMKWFGLDEAALEAIVGRNSKGKRKGQLKGSIVWGKTTVGGWYKSQCRVSLPGEIHNPRIVDSWNTDKVLYSKGMLREQELEKIAIDAIKTERAKDLEVARKTLDDLNYVCNDKATFDMLEPVHQNAILKIQKEFQEKVTMLEALPKE